MPECRASATSHALAWLLFFWNCIFFSANAQLQAYALLVWWCWNKQLLITSYFCLATPVSICYEFPKKYFGNQVIVNTSWHCHKNYHSVFSMHVWRLSRSWRCLLEMLKNSRSPIIAIHQHEAIVFCYKEAGESFYHMLPFEFQDFMCSQTILVKAQMTLRPIYEGHQWWSTHHNQRPECSTVMRPMRPQFVDF